MRAVTFARDGDDGPSPATCPRLPTVKPRRTRQQRSATDRGRGGGGVARAGRWSDRRARCHTASALLRTPSTPSPRSPSETLLPRCPPASRPSNPSLRPRSSASHLSNPMPRPRCLVPTPAAATAPGLASPHICPSPHLGPHRHRRRSQRLLPRPANRGALAT